MGPTGTAGAGVGGGASKGQGGCAAGTALRVLPTTAPLPLVSSLSPPPAAVPPCVTADSPRPPHAELCATYLSRNRSTAAKYNDFYELPRQALNLVDGSSYAEGLVSRYPAFARKVVDRANAAREASVRYVAPSSVEEAYMTAAADAAM